LQTCTQFTVVNCSLQTGTRNTTHASQITYRSFFLQTGSLRLSLQTKRSVCKLSRFATGSRNNIPSRSSAPGRTSSVATPSVLQRGASAERRSLLSRAACRWPWRGPRAGSSAVPKVASSALRLRLCSLWLRQRANRWRSRPYSGSHGAGVAGLLGGQGRGGVYAAIIGAGRCWARGPLWRPVRQLARIERVIASKRHHVRHAGIQRDVEVFVLRWRVAVYHNDDVGWRSRRR
jgi:hypothetical protein